MQLQKHLGRRSTLCLGYRTSESHEPRNPAPGGLELLRTEACRCTLGQNPLESYFSMWSSREAGLLLRSERAALLRSFGKDLAEHYALRREEEVHRSPDPVETDNRLPAWLPDPCGAGHLPPHRRARWASKCPLPTDRGEPIACTSEVCQTSYRARRRKPCRGCRPAEVLLQIARRRCRSRSKQVLNRDRPYPAARLRHHLASTHHCLAATSRAPPLRDQVLRRSATTRDQSWHQER